MQGHAARTSGKVDLVTREFVRDNRMIREYLVLHRVREEKQSEEKQ